MIKCVNQGPNGPSFSKLTVSSLGRLEATFNIEASRSGDTVILDKKNVAILARKLLAWSGEPPEVPPVVTGDL